MRKTKRQIKREQYWIKVSFIVISVVGALMGEGTVTVYQAKASPETQILPVSDEKQELVSGIKEGKSSVPSASQKAAAEMVCRKHFGGSSEMVDQCRWDLLAIAYTESRFNCESVGDNSKARGCYQIWYKLHKITVEQAEDFEWAANWTLERMISQGFPVYRSWALGSHNSFTPEVNSRYSKIVKEKSAEFERAGL